MTDTDRWRSIPGYPGYFITEEGAVFANQVAPPTPVEPYILGGVYIVRIRPSNAFRPLGVKMDELMRRAFLEEPRNVHLYDLVHIDGDITNCHVSNYGWVRKFIPVNVRNQDD